MVETVEELLVFLEKFNQISEVTVLSKQELAKGKEAAESIKKTVKNFATLIEALKEQEGQKNGQKKVSFDSVNDHLGDIIKDMEEIYQLFIVAVQRHVAYTDAENYG